MIMPFCASVTTGTVISGFAFVRHATRLRVRRHFCQLRQFITVNNRLHQIGGIVLRGNLSAPAAPDYQACRLKFRGHQKTFEPGCAGLMVSALTCAMRIPSRVRAMVNSAFTALRSRSLFLVEQRFSNSIGQAAHTRQGVVLNFQIESRAIRRSAGIVTTAVHFEIFGQDQPAG